MCYVRGISAAISTFEYLSCKFCHSKVVSEVDLFAEYSKCSAMMKMSYCKETKSAKFMVMDESSNHHTTMSVFEPVHSRSMDGMNGHSLFMKLLKAPSK